MKGMLRLKALRILAAESQSTIGFLEAFFASSKSDYRALRRIGTPRYRSRTERKAREEEIFEGLERQRLYELLHHLEKDGLITQRVRGNKKMWMLSFLGRAKKKELEERFARTLPEKDYPREPTREVVIVSFDIPESERMKRVWLREVLLNLGFRNLQRSVLVGKVKIPRELIEDLRTIHLIDAVEIFSVSRAGSIVSVV